MDVHAWAARHAGDRLQPFDYDPGPRRDDEVEIAISHCGICHSDVHLVDGDWGDVFPVVPGHEIIGTVVDGPGFAAGARVGVGWQRSSCGACSWCRSGEETLCEQRQATCMGHYGGFADRIRVDRRFVFAIPPALDSAGAAPLLCGGITVFAPLRRHAVPGMRVGVIGIGGLGHLALQFAAALGCDVTAFTTSPDKEDAARAFGAHHVETGPPAPSSLDLVLNTAHATPMLEAHLWGLRPKGTFCQLGAPPAPMPVPSLPLVVGQRCVCGSAVGDPAVIREMLEFAAAHGIEAAVETAPLADADAALARTRLNGARYRMVLHV